MAITVVDSAGQVRIPDAVREKLHLHEGDKLDFAVLPEGQVVLRPVTATVADLAGMLKRPGQSPAAIEDMDAAVGDMIRRDFG